MQPIHNRMIRARKSRRNLFTAAIDDFFEPASYEQIAVRIEKPFVPGFEPAVAEGTCVGRRIVLVGRNDTRTTDHNFPLQATVQKMSLFVNDGDLGSDPQ